MKIRKVTMKYGRLVVFIRHDSAEIWGFRYGLTLVIGTLKLISPTHKRTEGRAPVWGSELTSKDAALQGDPAETVAGLNVKLWTSVPACVAGYGFLAQSSF